MLGQHALERGPRETVGGRGREVGQEAMAAGPGAEPEGGSGL